MAPPAHPVLTSVSVSRILTHITHSHLETEFPATLVSKALRNLGPGGDSTQYYAFKLSIYWPAVYEALTAGDANTDLLRHCTRFFTSFAELVPSAAATVAICKPSLWTLCTR